MIAREQRVLLDFGGQSVEAELAWVVLLQPGAEPWPELERDGTALGTRRRSWRVPVLDAEALSAAADRWLSDPRVRSAMPDLVWGAAGSYNDPEYPGQWYLERIGIEPLHAVTRGSADVRVAVLDSGIATDHPDLAAAVTAPLDVYGGDADPRPNPGEFCLDGETDAICDDHGTAVSGIIAARADNGEGIVGLCPECSLVPIKLLGPGSGGLSSTIAAFEHAIDTDVAVVNNSWGYDVPVAVPEVLAEVISDLGSQTRGGLGSVVVFAAGNDDREIHDDELCGLPEVVCVTATDRYDFPTAYTNEGDVVDVAAPSATVSTAADGYTYTFGGTSAAAPVVAGIAAWMIAARPDLSAAEVRRILVDTAAEPPGITFDETGHDPVYGYGLVDAGAILDALFPEEPLPEEDEGAACGCSTASTATAWPAWLMVLLLPWCRRVHRSDP